jgi:uncharacterized protein (TIGR03067 family)
MRRAFLLLAGALLSMVVLGSDSPKEYDDKTEAVGIEGTWRQTGTERNGSNRRVVGQQILAFRRGTYTIQLSDADKIQETYRIDPTFKPPHLDQIVATGPAQGQTFKSIYQLDGDTLRIARFSGHKGRVERPQGFNDKGLSVMIFKRVK